MSCRAAFDELNDAEADGRSGLQGTPTDLCKARNSNYPRGRGGPGAIGCSCSVPQGTASPRGAGVPWGPSPTKQGPKLGLKRCGC